MDRRAAFFLLASVVGFALTPVADPEHRFVSLGVGVVYALLAVASMLDARSRSATPPRRTPHDDTA
jgi:hypothetical protein